MIGRITSGIYQSNNIREVLKYCSFDSWLVLDLDNTVYECLEELGSDQWFTCFMEYAARIVIDEAEAFNLVIAIYDAVQYHINHKTVEPNIINIINAFQAIGIPVLGLTARSNRICVITQHQLTSLGIDFSRSWDSLPFALGKLNNQTPVFHDGIIFCDGMDKGVCLDLFFKQTRLMPKAVVMADDKEKHLLAVKRVIENAGGRFIGVRYGCLDEKVARVDFQKATAELHAINHKLPKKARDAIKQLKLFSLFSLQENHVTDENECISRRSLQM